MKRAPLILYFGGFSNNASQCMKLAGIRRWAAALGWKAKMIQRPASTPENLPALLSRYRPVGCICEGSGHWVDLPPRLFGKTPVAYIEYPPSVVAGKTGNILVDDDAIARTALQELSAGRPSCYAAVGFPRPWLWSRLRVRAFRKAVVAAGWKCVTFPAVPITKWEKERAYSKRLIPWLASLPKGCAIFTVCDDIAMLVTRSARAAGRHIPKELTLLSTDNISETCEEAEPHISSIQLDFERMGFLAARALGEQIARGEVPGGESQRMKSKGAVTTVGPLLTVRRKSTSSSATTRRCMCIPSPGTGWQWHSTASARTSSSTRRKRPPNPTDPISAARRSVMSMASWTPMPRHPPSSP